MRGILSPVFHSRCLAVSHGQWRKVAQQYRTQAAFCVADSFNVRARQSRMLLPGNHLRRSSYRSREFEPVQERRVCTELAVCSKWSVTRWYCEEYRSVLTTAIARSSVSCAAPVCIKLNPAPGGDNNLNVILSTYEPHHNIRCGRSENFGNAPSCENVLADMPATEEMTLFGPGTAPGIEEPLPQLIASGKPTLR